MEDLDSLWNYQESFDELKLELQCTAIELEPVRTEAKEQIKKYRDEVNHLVNLVKLACEERDESQNLVNKLMASSSSPTQLQPYSENLLTIAAKANSSITESNSLSDTYNHHHSRGSSSPEDSLFDVVTSPDFWTAEDSVIDNLAKGKILPEKGKLLEAVMEASPLLLQTLLFTGTLPRWRNPPPLQDYKIPPVSMKRQRFQ
ncbi:TOX high mobility group box family member 4-A [Hibiscus syriacus]|uniref:TOX high mobility group box family member 4-A n=1 Tax=Hibiscus syriacus TaxID=106335 RepID=A0A6A2Z802_HIBSY|nr:uncharacterized protein LOC120150586 [Hibiscus syriacus]KAE8687262.1 TOX high mobility group box family member 4-A [Hibiscus syriacus]